MSVCVRYRYYQEDVIINHIKVISGQTSMNTNIPALYRGGRLLYKPFAGVIDADYVPANAKKIKLVNITGLWWDDSNFEPDHEIPLDNVVLGFYLNDTYYIGIRDDSPVHWPATF